MLKKTKAKGRRVRVSGGASPETAEMNPECSLPRRGPPTDAWEQMALGSGAQPPWGPRGGGTVPPRDAETDIYPASPICVLPPALAVRFLVFE